MSVHRTLQAATRDAHLDLERRLWPLVARPARPMYEALLARMLGLVEPFEAGLGARPEWEDAGVRFEDHRRAPRLIADLRALGMDERAVAALPRSADTAPCEGTFGEAWGTLYVLEGSRAGGRVIAARLATIGITGTTGGLYFGGSPADPADAWPAFLARLERYADQADAEPAIVAGARATFAAMSAWLAPLWEGGRAA